MYIYIYIYTLDERVVSLSLFTGGRRMRERGRRRRRRARRRGAIMRLFIGFLFLQTNFFPPRFFLSLSTAYLHPPRLNYSFFPSHPSLVFPPRPHSARPGSRINTVFAARFYANVIRLFAICPGKFCRRCFRVTVNRGACVPYGFPIPSATNASIP